MTVEVVTFGCRLNAAESEVIRREATGAGFSDTVVVNTCAVTSEAVRQARQAIRALRRRRPSAQIIVTGCAAQTEPQTFAKMPEADRVLGNGEKLSSAGWTQARSAFAIEGAPKAIVSDIMAVKQTAPHLVDAFAGRARAFVQVQNGCDHRCTFCIIPFGRGNSRSVPMGAVVEDVRRLVANGYREIVLTGVDVTSYGADLPGTPKLGALVKQILKHVPELPRLRLSSIDSVEADRELLEAIGSEPRLMPHLHLSLQTHEAAARPRSGDRIVPALAAIAVGHRLRRRLDRRLPDRNRRHVPPLARPRCRMRLDLSARVSILTAAGYAGGADAANRHGGRARTGPATARAGCTGVAGASRTRARRQAARSGGVG